MPACPSNYTDCHTNTSYCICKSRRTILRVWMYPSAEGVLNAKITHKEHSSNLYTIRSLYISLQFLYNNLSSMCRYVHAPVVQSFQKIRPQTRSGSSSNGVTQHKPLKKANRTHLTNVHVYVTSQIKCFRVLHGTRMTSCTSVRNRPKFTQKCPRGNTCFTHVKSSEYFI